MSSNIIFTCICCRWNVANKTYCYRGRGNRRSSLHGLANIQVCFM